MCWCDSDFWTLGFKGGVQYIEVDVIPKYTVICFCDIINNNEIFINISTMKLFAKKSGINVQKLQVKFSVYLPVSSSRNLHCWIFVLWMPKSVRRTCWFGSVLSIYGLKQFSKICSKTQIEKHGYNSIVVSHSSDASKWIHCNLFRKETSFAYLTHLQSCKQ